MRNYHTKLSASILYVAENVGIIGILAYPKILFNYYQAEERYHREPIPFTCKSLLVKALYSLTIIDLGH